MTLKLFSLAKNELETLDSKSQIVERKIVTDQHQYFVDSSGLRPFLDVLYLRNNEVGPPTYLVDFQSPLSKDPQFSIENLGMLSRTLEEFLPNALMDAQLRLQKLTSPRLANRLTQDAASQFIGDFVIVEDAIRSNIELSLTVFPRSVEEVRLLLGF